MSHFTGIHPVLQTPFAPDPGQPVLHDALGALVESLVATGVQGVVGLGLASEASTLTERERDEVCATITERLGGRRPFTVGIDGATAVAVDRARRAAALGAAGLMVIPAGGATGPAGVAEHVAAVAEAGGVPVVLQDAPQVTGLQLPVELLVRLADHPLVGAVKVEGLGAGPKISALVGEGLTVMAGWGGLHYPESLDRGASGCMPGSDLAEALLALHGLAEDGRHDEADALYRAILPLLVYETQSLPILVLGEKRALTRAGLFPSGALRAPAPALDARQAQAFDALFDRLERDGVPGPWRGADHPPSAEGAGQVAGMGAGSSQPA